jgi:hypothetical protein
VAIHTEKLARGHWIVTALVVQTGV